MSVRWAPYVKLTLDDDQGVAYFELLLLLVLSVLLEQRVMIHMQPRVWP